MKSRFSVFYIFFAITFFMSSLFVVARHKVFAENNSKETLTFESQEVLLLDSNTNTIIYKQNELEKRPIASMCKVMTLLLCFDKIENGDFGLDDTIVVSENASSMGGSQVFLEKNGEYKVCDLIKSIVVASANDSCVAMAEKIAGSEENFVNLMNEKAKELGMENTCFVNCTGLPKDGQYSCALDVSKMFLKLISHEEYFNFSTIWMDKIYHNEDKYTEISNTNKLIRFYDGCDSGKTGYTSSAGHCLVASAKRNDMRLVCVVINSPDSKTRFKEVSSLFNYGFNNYVNKLIIDENNPLIDKLTVKKGKQDTLEVCVKKSIYLFSEKNQKRNVEIVVKAKENLVAPIFKNDEVGEICLYENGIQIACEKIVANHDVLEKIYADYVNDVIDNWQI